MAYSAIKGAWCYIYIYVHLMPYSEFSFSFPFPLSMFSISLKPRLSFVGGNFKESLGSRLVFHLPARRQSAVV